MIYAPVAEGGPAKWGVVCTCREPTQLVVAFVAHHVALGASEIHIFLDEPQPDLEALLAQVPQVHLTVCDAAYWQETLGKPRPVAVEPRQLSNVFHVYHKTKLPWIAHLDSDEFLHADLPISDLLDAVPPEVEYLIFGSRERAFVEGEMQQDMFDGVFRQPVPRTWAGAPYLFNKGRRYTLRGILGHPNGKSIMRTGCLLVPGIHTPRRPAQHRAKPLHAWDIQRARLLHFDGLTAMHWSAKLLRAAEARQQRPAMHAKKPTEPRDHQIIRMRRLGGNLGEAYNLHHLLKTIPTDQMARLEALALVERYELSIASDIEALGLDQSIDLSRAGFDAALAAQQPQIREWHDPWQQILAEKEAG